MSTVQRGILSHTEARSLGGRLTYWLIFAFLLALSLAFVFPFFYALTAGLKNSAEIYRPGLNLLPKVAQWKNYADAWQRFNMLGMFRNSFAVALGGVAGQLLISSLAAYSLARLKPVGGKLMLLIFLMSLAIPGIAYIIPLYITLVRLPILNISLLNNYWGLWLPYSVSAFAILMLKNFFEQIPQDIYDAAAVDGASPLRIFFTITLPLSRSILLILAMLSFVGLWKDFMLPLLVLREASLQPITVRLYTLVQNFPQNLQLAAAFMAMVPPLIVAFLMQRYMKGGMLLGSVKG
ncbi:carbohydrate ABC transporter permease [Chloroflexia bacterium SDU3-3]|nr:carbohydrate ABC transporter permease [Chloroflexia bacterium SDU3-3]